MRDYRKPLINYCGAEDVKDCEHYERITPFLAVAGECRYRRDEMLCDCREPFGEVSRE